MCDELPEISLHAMAGQISHRTLRLQAIINGFKVQTLIYGGSTHNFIQERVAKFLRLPIVSSSHFRVLVGNGQSLTCEGYCPQIAIQLGSETFSIDLFVLQIQGTDVVLGVKWLEFLGPITNYYQRMYMEFTWADHLVCFQGEPLLQVAQVHFHRLKRLSETGVISDCFQLLSITTAPE